MQLRILACSALVIAGFMCVGAAGSDIAQDERAAFEVQTSLLSESCKAAKWREACLAAAEIEHELRSRYSEGQLELGLFTSPAHHLQFHSEFEDWVRASITDMGLPRWLPMMGFDAILVLRSPSDDERLAVMSMDFCRIERRMGEKHPRTERLTEHELSFASAMFAAQFGAVASSEIKSLNGRRTVRMEITPPLGSGPLFMVCLDDQRRVYCFLLTSTRQALEQNQAKLDKTLSTLAFDFSPPDKDSIRRIREVAGVPRVPDTALECARKLADIGEYNDAAETISDLRDELATRLPGPQIVDDVASMPGYRLSLRNPDPKKWDMSTERLGVMPSVILKDRFSVKEEGLMIMVIDTVLTYGAGAKEAWRDEDSRKQFLINGGRGAATNIGELEDERFGVLKDRMAYQSTVNIPGAGMKARCYTVMDEDSLVMLFCMIDAKSFERRLPDYEAILRSENLSLFK